MRPLDGAQGRPPRLPRTMLLWIAPREDRAAIVGDLDEEFHQHRSAARYWTSALASMPAIAGLRWHRLSPLADLSRDLRHGLRSMRRHPGFAAAAIVTMALGAGVAIVVASVVQAILLRPLPYPDAARVEAIQERDMTRPGAGSRTSWSDYVELSERQHSYTVIAAFDGSSRTLTGNGPADRLPAVEVTASFFDVLGVAPSSGRGFVPSDAVSGGAPVVILSNGAWKRLLAGDGSAIGRTLTLNGTPHTVIGILPPGFIFPPRGGVDLWLPLRPSKAQQDRRYFHWLDIVARRRADVTAAQAHQELQAIAGEWQKRDAWHGSIALRRVSLRDDIVAGVRPAMLVLSGAALLLLLAAVTSVSGLILSRAAGRAGELDVRAALGATRFRLLRQLAVESACVASCGTALGLLLGSWAVSSFAAMVPARYRVSLPYADTIGVSPRAALFTLLFCCTAVIVASIAPAWRSGARRVPPGVGSVRTTQGRGTARLRTTLVAAQIALAVVLLAGAALIGRSVVRLTHVSPGFDLRGLITAQLSLPGTRYANADATRAAMDRLLERAPRRAGRDRGGGHRSGGAHRQRQHRGLHRRRDARPRARRRPRP